VEGATQQEGVRAADYKEDEQQDEVTDIAAADTVVQKDTMVVHVHHACFAPTALHMALSRW
jgi:hypothetical protein